MSRRSSAKHYQHPPHRHLFTRPADEIGWFVFTQCNRSLSHPKRPYVLLRSFCSHKLLRKFDINCVFLVLFDTTFRSQNAPKSRSQVSAFCSVKFVVCFTWLLIKPLSVTATKTSNYSRSCAH